MERFLFTFGRSSYVNHIIIAVVLDLDYNHLFFVFYEVDLNLATTFLLI